RLQFKAQATIDGVAVTADGKPVADYAVTLFPVGASLILPSNQVAVHDAGGAFVLKGLAAGTYDVLAATANNRSGRSSAIALSDGEHKTGVRIVIGQGTTLRGRVVEYGTGIAIPSAEVTSLSVGPTVTPSTAAAGPSSGVGWPAA